MNITTIVASQLTPAHIGRLVAFTHHGRVCGHLDAYCVRGDVTVWVGGHQYRNVPLSTEVDVITNGAS